MMIIMKITLIIQQITIQQLILHIIIPITPTILIIQPLQRPVLLNLLVRKVVIVVHHHKKLMEKK